MNNPLGWQNVTDFFQQHWLSAFLLSVTLVTVAVLFAVRWWLRRRWRLLLEGEGEDDASLAALQPASDEDRRAMELIREFRREVWQLPDAELQLSIEALGQRAVRIVSAIAAVYHPGAAVPQYEASLGELLQLVRRVTARLNRVGAAVPFRYLSNRKLSDYQRFYQIYQKINSHPILRLLKNNPHLYRLARWGLHLKNLTNPLYWAGKEISRESYFYLLRWFILAFISQVGREAMRVYSGRRFQTDDEREAVVVCHRLFALARRWGGPSAAEWAVLVELVSSHPAMEPEVKLQVLAAWSRGRLPRGSEAQKLETRSGQKAYRQGLRRLQDADSGSSDGKAELIEKELE